MSAVCAICGERIAARRDVVVWDTEVMHRECARSGRETRNQRLSRELAAVKAAVAIADERTLRAVSAQQAADVRLADARARLQDAMASVEGLTAQVAQLEDMVEAEARAASELRAQLAALMPQPANARASRSQPAAQDAGQVAPASDARDDAEVRFGLLELDQM